MDLHNSEPTVFNNKKIFKPQEKLLLHFDRINDWLNGKNVAPINVEISPSNKCNLHCSYCFYKNTHDTTIIDFDKLKDALSDMKKIGVKAISWTGGGEPTLHPQFNELVKYANSLGLKQGLFTNGTNDIKYPEVFEWIRVSVSDNKLFGDYIQNWSKSTIVGVCTNVTMENWKDLESLRKEAEEKNANYFQIRPALSLPGKTQTKLPENNIFDIVKQNAKIPVSLTDYKWEDYCKPKPYDKCYGHVFCPFIDTNGDVLSCAYHLKNSEYIFGNIYEKSFSEIWEERNSQKIKISPNCQTCCKNSEINELLYLLKHGKEHIGHTEFV